MDNTLQQMYNEFQDLNDNADRILWLESARSSGISNMFNINFDNLISAWSNTKNYKKKASSWVEDEDYEEEVEVFEEL